MPKLSVKQAEQRLIRFALTFPGALLEHPWGHDAVKVKGKMFATFGGEAALEDAFSMSVKLPVSCEMALTLPWVEPTGYGLGKSGWITARVKGGGEFDIETMRGWIDQSYRAVAPKALVKTLKSASERAPRSRRSAEPARRRARARLGQAAPR
jgi:predicted DNA-binding protein (MmcQ/YjbR family)